MNNLGDSYLWKHINTKAMSGNSTFGILNHGTSGVLCARSCILPHFYSLYVYVDMARASSKLHNEREMSPNERPGDTNAHEG